MQQESAVFVGLDTSKMTISVALAEDGRHGEVRFLGVEPQQVVLGQSEAADGCF